MCSLKKTHDFRITVEGQEGLRFPVLARGKSGRHRILMTMILLLFKLARTRRRHQHQTAVHDDGYETPQTQTTKRNGTVRTSFVSCVDQGGGGWRTKKEEKKRERVNSRSPIFFPLFSGRRLRVLLFHASSTIERGYRFVVIFFLFFGESKVHERDGVPDCSTTRSRVLYELYYQIYDGTRVT